MIHPNEFGLQEKTMDVEAYKHQRLTVQQNCIRIFDLHGGHEGSLVSGSLREVVLPEYVDAGPEYTALSYMWGPPSDVSPQPIWIDGQPMKIRNNLMAALQALRHQDETSTFWIDAICINQSDVTEKNHQVASMARIYRAAEAVKIWLGSDSEGSALAMTYVRDTGRSLTRSTSGTSHSSSPMREVPSPSPTALLALEALLNRGYWSRAWIIQEVILAKEIDVHCGQRTVAWETLVEACSLLSQQTAISSHSPAQQLMLRRDAATRSDRPLQEQTLARLVDVHQRCECADRRDRIFALLSLAVDCAAGQGVVPDYGVSRFELLVRVLLFCRPEGQILDFITLLWRVLLREVDDGQWVRAFDCWSSEVAMARGSRQGYNTQNPRKVRVTQFVTVESASSDWVRCTTVETSWAPEDRDASPGWLDSFHTVFATSDMEGTTAMKWASTMQAIDEYNVVVILGWRNLAVFSIDSIKAVGNPCATLQLHGSAARCTWIACARSVQ